MARKKLVERFQLGDTVEIYFGRIDLWIEGTIIKHQHPAVWVRSADGRDWFVTNGYRIRHSEKETAYTPRQEDRAA
ncbi:MAG: hypothetical protein AAF902_07300 [Chloroflexota bacterium]